MWNMAVNNISYPIYSLPTRIEKGYITKMIPFFFFFLFSIRKIRTGRYSNYRLSVRIICIVHVGFFVFLLWGPIGPRKFLKKLRFQPHNMSKIVNIEHLLCPKVGGQKQTCDPTFENGGLVLRQWLFNVSGCT